MPSIVPRSHSTIAALRAAAAASSSRWTKKIARWVARRTSASVPRGKPPLKMIPAASGST
jgi:hypothetical protein